MWDTWGIGSRASQKDKLSFVGDACMYMYMYLRLQVQLIHERDHDERER